MRKYLWMGLVVAVIGAFAWAGSNAGTADQNSSRVTAKQADESPSKDVVVEKGTCSGSTIQSSGMKTAALNANRGSGCCASGKIKTDVKTTMAKNHLEDCEAKASACTAKKTSAGGEKTSI